MYHQEIYRYHQINIEESGTSRKDGITKKSYLARIVGKLNRSIDRIGFSTEPSELLNAANIAIDEAYEKLENRANFERYKTIKHYEFFCNYLKDMKVPEEDINKFAIDLTVAQTKKDALQGIESSLDCLELNTDGIEKSLDGIANGFTSEWGKSLADVFDYRLKEFFNKE